MSAARHKLVVIGGGMTGHQVAFAMQPVMDVTLIDPKTYFEVPMALPRLLVEPGALSARLPYAEFLASSRHVQGQAIEIRDDAVTVETAAGAREVVAFDYAVLVTGSRYVDPLVKAEAIDEGARSRQIVDAHARLRAATRVVIVGGGPVGVETAAEIRETLPEVQVTLVHGGDRLLESAPPKLSAWASEALAKRGVEVILEDRVSEPHVSRQPTAGSVKTIGGRTIAADAVVWATGTRPVTEFIQQSWPEAIDEAGHVRVDTYLRVEGHPTVFAAGDITNLPEGRLGLITGFHAHSIIGNLKRLVEAGSITGALKPYKPRPLSSSSGRTMIVTLGRRDGLASLPFGAFRAPFIARNIKSKDMLVGRYRRGVGFP